MAHSRPALTAARRTRAAARAVLGATLFGLLGCQSPASPPPSAAAPSSAAAPPSSAAPPSPTRHRPNHRALGEEGGAVPDGTTVFDDDIPAVANLDPDLLGALHEAATEAAGDGIEFVVNSGWRSRAYQEKLLRQAVRKYGSEKKAARWVATPDTSPHVSGDAVDIGPPDAAAWLSRHGAGYGLCQIYRNEPWHYELRPAAVDDGCPTMYANPTHDPRMQ